MQTRKLFTVSNCSAGIAIGLSTIAVLAGANAATPIVGAAQTTSAVACGSSRDVDVDQASCENRVRKLVCDALVYLVDNDGHFPDSAGTFAETIAADGDENAQAELVAKSAYAPIAEFSYNVRLAGVDRGEIRDPAHTVLVYEGAGEHVAFRHGVRGIVAFVDGHVEEVTPHQAALLRWKP